MSLRDLIHDSIWVEFLPGGTMALIKEKKQEGRVGGDKLLIKKRYHAFANKQTKRTFIMYVGY